MNLQQRVEYLSNLTFLLDYHQKLGSGPNAWVIKEFTAENEILIQQLKDKHSETGFGNQQSFGDEERAGRAQSLSLRRK